jgi:mRNA-degrading endonuclease toxin of MazEF toxin-antitoxin module
VVPDQIRTIDRPRINKTVEKLTEKEIEKIKAVLKETFID